MEKMRKGTGLADLEKQLKKWMGVAGSGAEQFRALKQFPKREDTQGESNGL